VAWGRGRCWAKALWDPYSPYYRRRAVGAVGGVCGPPPFFLITPFTALLLTGDITVTGVQLDVASYSFTIALFPLFSLLSRTEGVSSHCVRKIAGKGIIKCCMPKHLPKKEQEKKY
jgi:hypothetical protein